MLSKFFLDRPVFAWVIAIVMMTAGGLAIYNLPISQYPPIAPPSIAIEAYYPGASAETVENTVTQIIEQKMTGLAGMLYLSGESSSSGSSRIELTFEPGTDPDLAWSKVQNKLQLAMASLPDVVQRQGVEVSKSTRNYLIIIGLISEDGSMNGDDLRDYAQSNLEKILSRVPGVGEVEAFGSQYAMRVWVDPDKLTNFHLTMADVIGALKVYNVEVSAGQFGGAPAVEGQRLNAAIVVQHLLQTPEEFAAIPIVTNPDGSVVRIKDIGRTELGTERYGVLANHNGRPAAAMAVRQAAGANALDTADAVKAKMKEMSRYFPPGMKVVYPYDTTPFTEVAIHEVVKTLFEAVFLVFVIMYLFMGTFRATLIPTMAIPVSLLGAFIAFPLLGFTVNVLSLLGLVLAIGIVVDDAIVVVEAVQVNIENGMNAKEATIHAMREVTAPVIGTTLVLIAVFVPVAAMGGITGRLYQQFAITIAVSVAFSSVNALTLSPALCSLLLKKPTPYRGPLGLFFKGFNAVFEKSTHTYSRFTNIVGRKITIGLILIAVICGGTGIVGKLLPGGFIPEEDMGYLFINILLPDAASLQRADVVARQVEAIASKYQEVEYVSTATGFSMLSGSMAPNSAFIFLSLVDWDQREITALDLVRRLNLDFRAQIRAAQVFAFGPPAIPGLGSGSGFSMMLQDRAGNTPAYLSENAGRFIQAASQRPEIGSIFTTFRPNVPQRYLAINRDKALKAGVSLNDMYTTIGAFLGGAYVNDFNRFGRLYKAYIQAENAYRQSKEQINLFFVKNRDGQSVPLSAFVEVQDTAGPDYTNRYNLYRSVELSGGPAPGYTSAQALDALEEVAVQVLPRDMGYEWSNMSYQEKKAAGSGAIVFVFSMVFVFLILAALYESWSLPWSILLGTPFAIFGALATVLVARQLDLSYENNVFAQISLVMLIGMAAKNAILIVEFANIKFNEGLSLFDAAMESARLRFRPILMTAFSFILGIFPLVVASGAGAEARKVMGMALLGGMTLATFLGVFLYPMLFVFIGKIARYEKKRSLETKQA